MVDNSGSTLTTDPNKTNRIATVEAFIQKYGAMANLTYSYSYFDSAAMTYDNSNSSFDSSSNQAFGNAASAQTALNLFSPIGASGSTVYSSAFERIQAIISADGPASSNASYVVAFMSDGQPKDLGNSASSQLAGIETLTNQLMALVPSGRLTLSSVYFGPTDAGAENNLETMASLGGGQFINTNVTTNFSIDSLITIPTQACVP